jgi:hypothetical protein
MSAVISHQKLMEVNSNDANTQATGWQIMQHFHLAEKNVMDDKVDDKAPQ